jgi:Glycosyl hydrolases family 8
MMQLSPTSLLKVVFLVSIFSSLAFAQDWYVGIGLSLSPLPITGKVGYTEGGFGVRLSADSTFLGPDVYGRFLLDEAQSNIYLGAGFGLGPFAFGSPGYSGIPLSVEGLLGVEWRINEVGLFLEGPDDGHFYYNAGRDPIRIGTDALLNNDLRSKAQVQKMSLWLESATASPEDIKAGYTLGGTPIGNYFTSFFVAPFGVAAMLEPTQQSWLNNLYDSVYQAHEDYYEDSITLLCLLIMTGNYWNPTSG